MQRLVVRLGALLFLLCALAFYVNPIASAVLLIVGIGSIVGYALFQRWQLKKISDRVEEDDPPSRY